MIEPDFMLLSQWAEVDRIMAELDRKEYVEGEMASALPDTPRRRFKRKPNHNQGHEHAHLENDRIQVPQAR